MKKRPDRSGYSNGAQSRCFGIIPPGLIGKIHINDLRGRYEDMWSLVRSGATPEKRRELIDAFRRDVGAVYFRLQPDLDHDLSQLYGISGSLLKCLWYAAVRWDLRPQKYFRLCGAPSSSGQMQAHLTQLANMPDQEETAVRWGRGCWREQVDDCFMAMRDLERKEFEFRQQALAVLQMGIGMWGLLAGLIGLAIALVSLAY